MNFSEKELEELAAKYAGRLLERARRNEPPVTETLQEIAAAVSAQMVGLENRFKSPESLKEKITERTGNILKNLSSNRDRRPPKLGEYVSRIAELNNDALRYTFILPSETYSLSFKKTLVELKASGYRIEHIWNAWKSVKTHFDGGYRGVNVTVISSQPQKFELQFHTAESFQLKTETHRLYKTAISIKTPTRKRAWIILTMVGAAENVPIPKGAAKL